MRYKSKFLRKLRESIEPYKDGTLTKINETFEPYKNSILKKLETVEEFIEDITPSPIKTLAPPFYLFGSGLWALYFFGTAQPHIAIAPQVPFVIYWYHKEETKIKNYLRLLLDRGKPRPDLEKIVSEYKEILEKQGALKEDQKEPHKESDVLIGIDFPEEIEVEQFKKQ